jgi:rubrerythrin
MNIHLGPQSNLSTDFPEGSLTIPSARNSRTVPLGLSHLGYTLENAPSTAQTIELREQTAQWWPKVLEDVPKLHAWLLRLRDTEARAEERFSNFADEYCASDSKHARVFRTIAAQEAEHARMITEVLEARGVVVDPNQEFSQRYWANVASCIISKETAAGVGFFAEDLSLQRMYVIIEHPATPADLRNMFVEIHYDEAFHTNALKAIAGEVGLKEVMDCHAEGLTALGLKIKGIN